MAFNPKTAYHIERTKFRIQDFSEYAEDYVTRPPYQRKVVWDTRKQQDLLDSLFRRYYIPSVVIREVELDEENTTYEVIDGQQRIHTVQSFFNDDLALPNSLSNFNAQLPNMLYSNLPSDIRRFVNDKLSFDVDIIKNIGDPHDAEQQEIATEIFWRLQQGESLNRMETAHARLSSLARNFLVKYADDYDFDYENYKEIDPNPNKHLFFRETYTRSNNRMQHLSLLGRFLLLEQANGPTEVGDIAIEALINKTRQQDGIGNLSFEKEAAAKETLSNLQHLHNVFHDDPDLRIDRYGVGVSAFRFEYFTVSCYLLLRHLRRQYVFTDSERLLLRDFIYAYSDSVRKVRSGAQSDEGVRWFAENSERNPAAIQERDIEIRHAFFKFAAEKDHGILAKDSRRVFSESDRIEIYRRDNGICSVCIDEGLPELEARVPWSEFEADHIMPHTLGGPTEIWNGQVLCRTHNRQKGATV